MTWKDRNAVTIEMALFFLCLIALSILFLVLAASWTFAATCVTYHNVSPHFLNHRMDGDTIAVNSLSPMILKFRVKDVDTPEKKDFDAWRDAREFTWQWLHQGPFDIYTCWRPTFERYEAVVSRNGQTLAEALKATGLGR